MRRNLFILALAAACAAPLALAAEPPALARAAAAGEKIIKSKKVGESMVVLSTKTGVLTSGENAIAVAVTDLAGKPKKASVKSLDVYMPPMGSMAAMKSDAKLQPARSPGLYTGTLDVEMKGAWKLTVIFQDEKGPHRASFNIVAR